MSGLRKYLIGCALLLVIYLIAQYTKPKPTNWSATYLAEDKIPFGTYILRQRITDLFPGVKVKTVQSAIYNNLKERPTGKSNYLIIASTVNVEKEDFAEMVKYMKAGNNIFIAGFQFKGKLLDTLKIEIGTALYVKERSKYAISFTNPSLKGEFDYYFDKGISNQFFSKIDTSKAIVLGLKQETYANFIQYKFGKGSLFLLPNPQLLTNYSVLKESGLDYASKALSYLPKAETLIWDEHFVRPNEKDTSMLNVLFRYEQLRWAYYIALFSLLVFVFFEIKRRQRIIPIAEQFKNTSAEFVQVIGRVYYQQRNNRDLADKKVNYLLEYIRTRYRLKTVELDKEFKEMLINISGATADTIEELMAELNYLKAGHAVSDQQLIRLNKLIEKFYNQDQ